MFTPLYTDYTLKCQDVKKILTTARSECKYKTAYNLMEVALENLQVDLYINLVRGIANKFQHFGNFEDLVQEGCIGLVKAHERFDPERGVKFSTYAYKWIWKYIKEESCRWSKQMKTETPLLEEFVAAKINEPQPLLKDMQGFFLNLSPRDTSVLANRVLLGRGLEEVGKELGVSRERVRQIESKIKENLKKKLRSRLGEIR